MIDFLNQQWWLAITLQAVLLIANHYLTIVSAKVHKAYANEHIVFENSYESNLIFEKSVAQLQGFTRKHFLFLLMNCISLTIARLVISTPFFEFSIGGCLLLGLYIDLRHLLNIIYFRDMRKPNSVTGRIEYSYWISQRASATSFITQSILLSIAALATQRPFFWGGVAFCLLLSFRDFLLANRKFPQTENA
jgi:hypothetical protein